MTTVEQLVNNLSQPNPPLTMRRGGIDIPLPSPKEAVAFQMWLKANQVNEWDHPDQHYDYVSAFRAGLKRDKKDFHFPDTYKLPTHPTFSDQSQYYQPGMKAGRWEGDTYIPIPGAY
jgi:hypothetical protein